MTFTLGVRGSYEEGYWTSHLAKFGMTGITAEPLHSCRTWSLAAYMSILKCY